MDVNVQLGRFWISNPAQSPQQSERGSKIQAFVDFLKASADNTFQGKEFQGEKLVRSWYKSPWRGIFPRNPLLSTVKLEVVGDNNAGTINQFAAAPGQFTGENPEPVLYNQVQFTQDPKNQIAENIKNRYGERIETEISMSPIGYRSTGADFMFQHPIGIPSAPTLEEIQVQEGPYQPRAAYQA